MVLHKAGSMHPFFILDLLEKYQIPDRIHNSRPRFFEKPEKLIGLLISEVAKKGVLKENLYYLVDKYYVRENLRVLQKELDKKFKSKTG